MASRHLQRTTLVVLASSLFCTASLPAQDASAAAIAGTWVTEDGDSKVEITCAGNACSGKVSWVKVADGAAAPVDAKNSDPALRGRPLLGIDILTGFSYKGNHVWDGGKVYAPRRGNSYNGTLTLNRDGTLSVKAKAGIGSKTVTWTRA